MKTSIVFDTKGCLRSLWHGRTWRCRWRPSTADCLHTPLGWGYTGSLCSWVSHRSPTHHFPPWWSYSGWSMCAGQHSRCYSYSSGPGISSPHKMWSGEKVRRKKFNLHFQPEWTNVFKELIGCNRFSLTFPIWMHCKPAVPSKYLSINKMCRVWQVFDTQMR